MKLWTVAVGESGFQGVREEGGASRARETLGFARRWEGSGGAYTGRALVVDLHFGAVFGYCMRLMEKQE